MSQHRDDVKEAIRERADIVEVVSEYLTLKKSGVNYQGLCPFHNEKTPSFSVNPEKRIFHCFGCGVGGDVFKFIEKIENLNFFEALQFLGKKYGIEVKEKGQNSAAFTLANKIFEANSLAVSFYRETLRGGEGKQPLEYLLKRGMSKESLERFNIGYAGRGGDSLQRYLQQRNIPLDIQDKGGLVRKNESGVGYRDRFKGRIIFPIKNETGQDVGLGGRIIETDSKRPKYLNSPETLVYKKREILYGLDLAKEFIRNEKQVVVVEGYMDLISLFQAEVRNVVATSGTALSPEHVKLLKRYADSAVIIFDGDQAGITAAQKASLMLGDAGIKVRVAVLPKGDDPDTFIKKVGKDGFLGFVEKALPLMEYIVAQSIAGKAVETIDDKVVVVESLIPYLDKLENSVERNHYVHMIADRLSVSEVSIREELEKRRRGSRKKDWLKEDKGSKYPNRAERDLIGLMLADFSSVAKIKDGIGVEEFGDALLREIAEMVYSLSSAGEITVGQLLDNLKSDEAKRLVTEAAVQAVDYQDIGKAIDDCLRDIKRKRENLPGQWKTADSKYERVKVLKEQLKTLKGTDNSKIH